MAIREELVRYAGTHSIKETRLLRRFEIMILIGNSVSLRRCAWYAQCSLTTVRRWGRPIEETAQLVDKARPGRPALFSEETWLRVIGFYCQNPLPGSNGWSVRWAAEYLNEHLEIIGRWISHATIHRILRMHSLRPHLIKYFLHITDPDFFPKMAPIIKLYLNPPEHLFCFDECTGLQALERLAVKMVTGHGAKIEFQYKRHGTWDVYCFLSVGTGKVFGKCTENHREETLIEVFTEHVSRQPDDAVLHYICDNLANHSSEPFCRRVAKLSGVPYPVLKTAPERREWLQYSEKRIMIHFVPFHGSWLNLVEIWFGILQMKSLKGRSSGSKDEHRMTIDEFFDTWNEHFAHPFSWTYTGKGLVEKAVYRLTNWLLMETKDMKPKFLHKQLLLMINVVRDYWSKAPQKRWCLLYRALIEKDSYLREIIGDDKKLTQSLTQLLKALSARLNTGIDLVA